jgi:chemotaxis protein MotB
MRERFRADDIEPDEASDHWMMYSDLMAGLVMMFILFLAVTIVGYHQVLASKEKRITELLGVQASIAQSLEHTFRSSNLDIKIDPKTGSIRFASDVLFSFNSYQLSARGKQSLESFIPQYISVLLSPKYRNDVSAIMVVGYTDKQGSYLYNLKLSQERASSVVNYILSPSFPNYPDAPLLPQYIVAEGRSFNNLVYLNGVYSAAASRRVVFSFQLKDTSILRSVKQAAGGP